MDTPPESPRSEPPPLFIGTLRTLATHATREWRQTMIKEMAPTAEEKMAVIRLMHAELQKEKRKITVILQSYTREFHPVLTLLSKKVIHQLDPQNLSDIETYYGLPSFRFHPILIHLVKKLGANKALIGRVILQEFDISPMERLKIVHDFQGPEYVRVIPQMVTLQEDDTSVQIPEYSFSYTPEEIDRVIDEENK
jgi:hypothetical protein